MGVQGILANKGLASVGAVDVPSESGLSIAPALAVGGLTEAWRQRLKRLEGGVQRGIAGQALCISRRLSSSLAHFADRF